jgi:hypothetical protein
MCRFQYAEAMFLKVRRLRREMYLVSEEEVAKHVMLESCKRQNWR